MASPWGPPTATSSYGQIITPTGDGLLTDFTFYIKPFTTDPINYRAHVFAWDPAGGPGVWKPTGPSHYDSAPLTFSGTPNVISPVTITTGQVRLTAGTPYALFLSTVGESQSATSQTEWGIVWGVDSYPGGTFVFSNNATSYTAPWEGFPAPYDLAFKANIQNVPGPLPLLGAAAALGWSRKLRRRADLHPVGPKRAKSLDTHALS